MNEKIIVDADGVVLKRKPIPKFNIKKRRITILPTQPTGEDLDKLEQAIFEHGEPYRKIFLNMIKVKGFDKYLEDMGESSLRRMTRYAWTIWKWRPEPKLGLRVIVIGPSDLHIINPYRKKYKLNNGGLQK